MPILDLFFPKNCLECHKGNKYICNQCLSKVELLTHFNPFTQTYSIFKYEGVIRKAIIKIKYNFAFDIAQELSEICVKNLKLKNKNCLLLPIPLHKSREKWRGFNQSEILGRLISQKMGWQFNNNVLIRPKGGKTQVGLRGIERARNICGKFTVNPEAKLYQTRTYILFDDVATTGSTIKEGIKVLKTCLRKQEARANKKVFGLTIAR